MFAIKYHILCNYPIKTQLKNVGVKGLLYSIGVWGQIRATLKQYTLVIILALKWA